jgi:pyruvate dehydrogenase E1 component alpha subunit
MISGMTDADKPLASAPLRALYRTMVRIRIAETRLSALFAAAEVPGFIHSSLGQEAVAAGVAAALAPGDTITTTHRGHGHVLARGVGFDPFFREVMGRAGGICGGRGGSMHIADVSLGVLGANGIVGAGIPIAAGSALAHRVRGTGAVAAAFFGDGALAEGVLHETLNMASLWKLPLVLVCENNGWSEFSPSAAQIAGKLEALAGAFAIDYRSVDGNDAPAVAQAAGGAVRHARTTGPAVLECITHRVRGHFEGDAQKYRDASELGSLAARDPIARAKATLLAAGESAAALAGIHDEIEAQVAAAIEAARADAAPDFAAALADVYTPEGH